MDDNYEAVKFGNSIGYKLRRCTAVLERLRDHYGIELYQPFNKTYNAVTTEEQLSDIIKYSHLLSYQLSAPLSYIYLTEHNGTNFCYYILPGDIVIATMHRFSAKLFQDETLFEGRIVDGIFLVEDIVIFEGTLLRWKQTLANRIKIINDLLDYHHQPDPVLDVYRIILKDYVDYAHLYSFMTDYLNGLTYKDAVTGLLFCPLGNCNLYLTMDGATCFSLDGDDGDDVNDDTEVIESPEHIHTQIQCQCTSDLNFLIRKTAKPDVYELYLSSDSACLKYHGLASVPDKATSALLKDAFKGSKGDRVMLCKYDDRPHIRSWRPYQLSHRRTPDTFKI